MSSAPRTDRPRAILFDAGNTLVFVDRARILRVFREHGVDSDEARFLEAEFTARGTLMRRVEAAEGPTGTEAHIWQEYFLVLFRGAGVPEERMSEVGAELMRVHEEDHLWTHVEPGTPEALEALRAAGFRMAVVSNADGRVEALLERKGLRGLFEFVLDSGIVGVEKPDPRIFHAAVDRMGLLPGECLYVGDLYPVDVLGARSAGLRALLLDPLDRLGHLPVDRIRSVPDLPAWLEKGRGAGHPDRWMDSGMPSGRAGSHHAGGEG